MQPLSMKLFWHSSSKAEKYDDSALLQNNPPLQNDKPFLHCEPKELQCIFGRNPEF